MAWWSTATERIIPNIVAGVGTGLVINRPHIPSPQKTVEPRQTVEPSRSETQPLKPESFNTTSEDHSVQAASFSSPGADESMGMGWGYRSEAECRLALPSLTKAIRIKPRSSNAYCKRAWVYNTMGFFRKRSEMQPTKAIRLNPKNAEAYQARSYAYSSLGQQSKADRDQSTYDSFPTDPH